MTDKQIIIDGVDVSECEYYQYKKSEDYEMRYPNSGDCHIGICAYLFNCKGLIDNLEKHCIDNPNCYYKQLKRKEQECESLKSAFSLDTKMLEQTEKRESNLEKQLDQLKAENEELKEKFKKFFNMDNQECWNIAFLDNERERYKQALDEIEKYCNKYNKQAVMGTANADVVLDIINKAKEE